MKSLGDIFRDAIHHHADRESPSHNQGEESPYLLLGQKAGPPEKSTAPPTHEELLNYLG
jgi:hypothetical protein